jgi:hypothetical protein
MGWVLFIFAVFEARLLFNSFKWEVFIQNHVIEACPTPKAEKWGTNWFIIGIYWSQLFTRIHAEACHYSIATKWGMPLFKYTYWGMPLFLNEASHYSNTPIEAWHYSWMRHPTIQIHQMRHATIHIVYYSNSPNETCHYSNTSNETCHCAHCHHQVTVVCVECLIGKQRNQFSLRSQSRIPYCTELIPHPPKWQHTRTPHQ